jgi:hypothetical protein
MKMTGFTFASFDDAAPLGLTGIYSGTDITKRMPNFGGNGVQLARRAISPTCSGAGPLLTGRLRSDDPHCPQIDGCSHNIARNRNELGNDSMCTSPSQRDRLVACQLSSQPWLWKYGQKLVYSTGGSTGAEGLFKWSQA